MESSQRGDSQLGAGRGAALRGGRGLLRTAALLALLLPLVVGHGRLYDPPGRSTLWRHGFRAPPNYDDNQLFCGGFARQVKNGGKCGVCGDPWDGERQNEAGGKYAKGIIAKTYAIGQLIEVTVQITANHKGFFQFRLCPNDNVWRAVTQECLDRHLLRLADGSTRYNVTTARTGDYVIKVQLPSDVMCEQCVLQWRYHTGNSWGCYEDGECCLGCGLQEEFYGCSDIAIKGGNSNSGGNSGNQGTQPIPEVRCRASAVYSSVPLADQWCQVQCKAGYCPLSHCDPACQALLP